MRSVTTGLKLRESAIYGSKLASRLAQRGGYSPSPQRLLHISFPEIGELLQGVACQSANFHSHSSSVSSPDRLSFGRPNRAWPKRAVPWLSPKGRSTGPVRRKGRVPPFSLFWPMTPSSFDRDPSTATQ